MEGLFARMATLDQTHLKLVSRVMDVPVGLVTVSEYPDLRRHDTSLTQSGIAWSGPERLWEFTATVII